jgi:hypothetical protein
MRMAFCSDLLEAAPRNCRAGEFLLRDGIAGKLAGFWDGGADGGSCCWQR